MARPGVAEQDSGGHGAHPMPSLASAVQALSLIHHGNSYLTKVRSVAQRPDEGQYRGDYEKPRGLWVSVEGDDDWASWCRSEGFRNIDAQVITRVTLSPDANVLLLANADEIDAFSRAYGFEYRLPGSHIVNNPIDWQRVAGDYDGLIIAPYIWDRRIHTGSRWYYGWDCASGCIWNKRAIGSLIPEAVTEGV